MVDGGREGRVEMGDVCPQVDGVAPIRVIIYCADRLDHSKVGVASL